jgi:hypothetical protein
MTAPTKNKQGKAQGKVSAKFVIGLPPQDPVGAEFTEFFNHPWDFIEASVPLPGERASWKTVNRYPLQPRNLWDKYLEPDLLLGLRFGSFTKYFVLDLDRKGCYHPLNNKEKFEGILQALREKLGVSSFVIVQSSDSGGIHIYGFLPEAVHSYTLAVAIKAALNAKGFRLFPGRLEIFPNDKAWKPGKPSNYHAHRLPLQAGSFLLGQDLRPVPQASNNIEEFLEQASLSARSQDTAKLREALEGARGQKQYYRGRSSNAAEEFRLDLQSRISQGWTGYSQTNYLLRDFAVYGIVFLALSGESLVQYIKETAENSPGYVQYCRHQHEIEKRARERAASAESYPYYPYPNSPVRDKTYKEHFCGNEEMLIPREDPSRKRHRETVYKVTAVVTMLKNQGLFPATITRRIEAIKELSKEAFDEGVSPQTLYKKEYKYLWHTDFDVEEIEAPVKADSSVVWNAVMPSPWNEVEIEEKIEGKAGEGLQVICLTECLLCLPAGREVVEEVGQGAKCESEQTKFAGERSAAEPQAMGELTAQENLINPFLDRALLILHCSIILQILSLATTAINVDSLDSLISANNSNSCIQEVVKSLESFIDKYLLYSATAEKSPIFDNKNLLLLSVILAGRVEGNRPQPAIEANESSKLEANIGACVSLQETIATPVTQYNLTPSQGVLSKQQEAICECGNPHDLANQQSMPTENQDAQASNPNANPNPDIASLEQIQAVQFLLQARPEAKRKVQEFCATFNLRLAPKERDTLEQFLKYCLMQRSPFEALRLEARAWFKASRDLIAQIDGFTAFWDYFGELVF